jgi:DNA processing protein
LFDELDFFAAPAPAPFVSALGATDIAPSREQTSDVRDDAVSVTAPVHDPVECVTSLLGPAPISVNELVRLSGLSAQIVNGVLVELDIAGRISRPGPDLVSLVYIQ